MRASESQLSAARPDSRGQVRPNVGVVIPYYQREPGLLRNAVDSVFSQDVESSPLIVVVDDASPHPPEGDLESLDPALRNRVTVIRQPNAGPGAARNRGLDSLPTDVEFVAFLDSDDVWRPEHLAKALAALQIGYDFFFANFLDIDTSDGAFQVKNLVRPSEHRAIDEEQGIYEYSSDLRAAVLRGCPIETSTVVFRRAALADVRFRSQFRDAYEDLMFWFEVAARTTKVAFGAQVGVQYGRGINIYRGVATGSDAAFRALVASSIFRSSVRALFPLPDNLLRSINTKLSENRKAVAYDLLHRLRRGLPVQWREVRKLLRSDPRATVLVPFEISRQLAAWLLRRPTAD